MEELSQFRSLEYSYSDEHIDNIADEIGLHRNIIREIIDRFGLMLKNPQIIDTDDALIKAYCRKFREVYKLGGGSEVAKTAARDEVNRLITLGTEMRKLKDMIVENKKAIFPESKGGLNIFYGWKKLASEENLI